MKNFLLSSAALVGLTAAALAADLPYRAPVSVAVPAFTWTGFYVGVNAGYAWSNDDEVTFAPGGLPMPPFTADQNAVGGTFTFEDSNDGALGGAQVGYNFQFGSFVVGVEADIQAIDLTRKINDDNLIFVQTAGTAAAATSLDFIGLGERGIDWFSTVRARGGFGFDRALVYATGGLAFSDSSSDDCGRASSACSDDKDWRNGYAVGGGVEYAFTNNLTAKLEGLYVNLNHGPDKDKYIGTVVAADTTVAAVTTTSYKDFEFGLVRAGVNYKF
jgi:outer membrane immunogenic protein